MKEETEEKTPEISDWREKVVAQVKTEWDRGFQYVDDLNRLYEDIYAMLRGERPEKTYDWQSNVVINKVFQIVWTTIPYVTQKIFSGNPIVGVKGPDKKAAIQRENILQTWYTLQPGTDADHNPYFLVVTLWLLRALLNGVGIMKKSWHQKLKSKSKTVKTEIPKFDEEGNQTKTEPFSKTFNMKYPVEDWPYNVVVNNQDIVVDWLLQPGQSIRQGRFIIHRELTDLDDLYQSGIYENLDELETTLSATDVETVTDKSALKSRDGQDTPPESDVYTDVEIYERVGKYPIYNEKQDGKWVACFDKDAIYNGEASFKEMIVTVVLDQNQLIRFEPNPYGLKNYIDIHMYLDPERWHSIGQVEPIKDLSTALNDNMNAAFDEIWQNLMTPAIVNKNALWDWDTMQYAPGQKWMVAGDPSKAITWKTPSNITTDSWQKHSLLNNEIDLTSSITPPMQGLGKEKAATTNIMNAQMSAGKLDFLIRMVEITGLIPSAQMDVEFARKFAHPLTFKKILGADFKYDEFTEELYKYIPAASSVKLEYQKDAEIAQDTQLLQVVSSINNPGVAKIQNKLIANIFRNRNWDEIANILDEDFYEAKSDSGNAQMLSKMIGEGATSNQGGLPMSTEEKNVRQGMFSVPSRMQ